jgi:hypothetical protein
MAGADRKYCSLDCEAAKDTSEYWVRVLSMQAAPVKPRRSFLRP